MTTLLRHSLSTRHSREGGNPASVKKFLLSLFFSAFVSTSHAEPFGRMELAMGMYRIDAEVAASEETREQGLMYREKLPANSGMLFVFVEPQRECMWMKNTLIPLSVAFLDDNGNIVNIEDMAPQTLNSHCSNGKVRYALEMNVGWFKERGFGKGMQLRGLEKAPLPR